MQQPLHLESATIHPIGRPLIAEIELGLGVQVRKVSSGDAEREDLTFDEITNPDDTTTEVTSRIGVKVGGREISDVDIVTAKTSEIDTALDEAYPTDETHLF